MALKFDVYAHVTDTIIAEIEAGTPPWRKPWTGSASGIAMPTRHNGEEYRGINILMLWVMAAKQGHVSSRWMTYKQAQELGGQVRKGETSSTVVKYGTFTRENELGIEEELPYARAYRVFNADQIEGLSEEYYIRPEAPRDLGTAEDPELEAFFSRTGAEILTSDDPRAYYSPAKDHIHMPPITTFHNAAGYYGTLAHEVIHNAALRFMPRRPLQPVALRLDRRSISA
jgi:antirestriction protein ArdC